jgi:hypothetical protein
MLVFGRKGGQGRGGLKAYHRYHEIVQYVQELTLEGLKSKVVSTGWVGSAGLLGTLIRGLGYILC